MSDPLHLADGALQARLIAADRRLRLELRDADGRPLGASPLLRLEIHDKMYRRCVWVDQYQVLEAQSTEAGLHVTLAVERYRLQVGFWLSLEGGEVVIRLYPMEVYEGEPRLYRLFGMEWLPELMSVHGARGGRLLLPITTGALCDPTNQPALADRFMIYGEQERAELLPLLPVCAAGGGQGGWVALAATVACDATCHVQTDGQGGGRVAMGTMLRRYWPDPVDTEMRQVRFTPIPGGADLVHFTAQRLRRHVQQDLGKPTLEQRARDCPQVDYLLRAYTMKLFFAVQNDEGILRKLYCPDDFGSPTNFDCFMTFAEAGDALEQLRRAGIERVHTEMTGWNPRGHDGMYPTRLPPDPRLGGAGGFARLIERGKGLGYQMSVHDNYIDAYRISPDFDEPSIIHDIHCQPLVMGWWGGGITYKRWPMAFRPEQLEGQMRQMRAFGLNGTYYCDAMGNFPEVNYHPIHGGPRSGHVKGINRVLQTARNLFGSCATECGFLYCSILADCISTVGWEGGYQTMKRFDWPAARLCDRQVPVWQLAMHGLTLLEGTQEPTWPHAMQWALFASHPRVEWSTRPGIFPVFGQSLIRRVQAVNDLILARLGHLQSQALVRYEQEGSTAQTTFEDGTRIQADFQAQTLIVNGQRIAPPETLIAPS